MIENSLYDKKSMRAITGKTANFKEIACDCVAFSNAEGGYIDFGIEDNEDEPAASQHVPESLKVLLQKRVNELTEGVAVTTEVRKSANGGEYLRLHVSRNPNAVSTTSSGQVFLRIGDSTIPVTSEGFARLSADKGCLRWEDQDSGVKLANADNNKLTELLTAIRESDRATNFVKSKTDYEILEYYGLIVPDVNRLSNLGVLFVGKSSYRGRLNCPLVVQCIKYDEYGEKVNKWIWNDFLLSPIELVADIWRQIPDWKESSEIQDGLFRRNIPAYDENVVRELLVNAIVHRPYTIRGDLFINLYPDRMEISNPGRLPLGVTPKNILHKTVKRNERMAALFQVLHLMEQEGSGYDNMYKVQLSQGKQVPFVIEGDDSVTAVLPRRIVNAEAIRLMQFASQRFDLRIKQSICLGIIAQHESISALQLRHLLSLDSSDSLRPWLHPLLEMGIVEKLSGRTSSVRYQVVPSLLREGDFKGRTSLKRIEDYRLKELVIEDLRIYKRATFKDIHKRIGEEIPQRRLRRILSLLMEDKKLVRIGGFKFAQYTLLHADSSR